MKRDAEAQRNGSHRAPQAAAGRSAALVVALIPVLGPLLIWAVVHVVNPGMIGDLPVIQQIQTMFRRKEKG